MKLVTLDCVPGGQVGAVLQSGEILHLERAKSEGTFEAWLPATMRGVLAAGEPGMACLRTMVARAEDAGDAEREAMRASGALLPATARLLAPVPDPTMIISIGQAYHSHVHEMKGKPLSEPHAFLKAPSAITGPGADVPLPPRFPDQVDFEGELCAVIGKTCHDVSVDEAMTYIAGYTITNDVSARDWVPLLGTAKTTPEARTAWDLVHMGKQLPGFSPMGPALVTADEVLDAGNLNLTTRVNGTVMQQANTSDLIFTLAEVVSYFSRWYLLRPGDIISTGTPGGVGYGRDPKVLLGHGDVVEVEVEGLGVLSNRFVARGA